MRTSCSQKMKYTSQCWRRKVAVLFMGLDLPCRCVWEKRITNDMNIYGADFVEQESRLFGFFTIILSLLEQWTNTANLLA